MKKILLPAFLLSLSISVFGQSDDIIMQKKFGGTTFQHGGRLLKPREVLTLMAPNPQAYAAFQKAKSNYDAGMVLGYVGGFLVGWPLGTALGGGDPEWGLAAAGAGLILVSIPLSSAFNKHAKTAVDLYNAGDNASGKLRPSFHFQANGAGAKVVMKF